MWFPRTRYYDTGDEPIRQNNIRHDPQPHVVGMILFGVEFWLSRIVVKATCFDH